MQTKNQARARILELGSESEYGSWEFWSIADKKTEEELDSISEAIVELVREGKIRTLEQKSHGTYNEVELDVDRLKRELRTSMKPDGVEPDKFYWFEATDEGKKEDRLLRS
jgi:hypothetical protein